MSPRLRVALGAALTLVAGFAVAVASGSRPLGGVVLVIGGGLCGWWMLALAGWVRTLVTVAGAFVLFVVSHPLGKVITPWPAVLVVAVAAGLIAWWLAGDGRGVRGAVSRG